MRQKIFVLYLYLLFPNTAVDVILFRILDGFHKFSVNSRLIWRGHVKWEYNMQNEKI